MIVSLAMFPTSKGTDSASTDVAKVIDMIDRSGLPYKLGPMATAIEGEWDEIMPLINRARKMLRRKHSRIYIVMTIDDRKGARNRLTGKVRSIETRLGREVSK